MNTTLSHAATSVFSISPASFRQEDAANYQAWGYQGGDSSDGTRIC